MPLPSPANEASAAATVEVLFDLGIKRDEYEGRPFSDYFAAKAGPPTFSLTVSKNGRVVERRLLSGSAAVGRGPANDIVIDDRSISREHCIVAFEEGRFIVRDCGSANGTLLRGQRVADGAGDRSPRAMVVVKADVVEHFRRRSREGAGQVVPLLPDRRLREEGGGAPALQHLPNRRRARSQVVDGEPGEEASQHRGG